MRQRQAEASAARNDLYPSGEPKGIEPVEKSGL
jgi:hypothetical protein